MELGHAVSLLVFYNSLFLNFTAVPRKFLSRSRRDGGGGGWSFGLCYCEYSKIGEVFGTRRRKTKNINIGLKIV
jgi:hypothetical protein